LSSINFSVHADVVRLHSKLYAYFPVIFTLLHSFLLIIFHIHLHQVITVRRRSRWLRGLRRRSPAAWLLGSWVRIPLKAWKFVSCVYMLWCLE
jgi:hypothetical protein